MTPPNYIETNLLAISKHIQEDEEEFTPQPGEIAAIINGQDIVVFTVKGQQANKWDQFDAKLSGHLRYLGEGILVEDNITIFTVA